VGERYQVRYLVGEGPTGAVYRALDQDAEIEVAVKIIGAERLPDADARERFVAQLARLPQVVHPNVVRCFEVRPDGPSVLMALQLVEGLSLRRLLGLRRDKAEPFSLVELEPIVQQIARGLSALHKRALVAGALRPENVLVLPDAVKVADAGLWRALPLFAQQGCVQAAQAERYLAPEARAGALCDARADSYSLAVLIEEMLGGPAQLPAPLGELLREAHAEQVGRRPGVEQMAEDVQAIVRTGRRLVRVVAPSVELPGASERASSPDRPPVDDAASESERTVRTSRPVGRTQQTTRISAHELEALTDDPETTLKVKRDELDRLRAQSAGDTLQIGVEDLLPIDAPDTEDDLLLEEPAEPDEGDPDPQDEVSTAPIQKVALATASPDGPSELSGAEGERIPPGAAEQSLPPPELATEFVPVVARPAAMTESTSTPQPAPLPSSAALPAAVAPAATAPSPGQPGASVPVVPPIVPPRSNGSSRKPLELPHAEGGRVPRGAADTLVPPSRPFGASVRGARVRPLPAAFPAAEPTLVAPALPTASARRGLSTTGIVGIAILCVVLTAAVVGVVWQVEARRAAVERADKEREVERLRSRQARRAGTAVAAAAAAAAGGELAQAPPGASRGPTVTPVLSPPAPTSADGCPLGTKRHREGGHDYCIDLYEYPGGRMLPRTGLAFTEAARACELRGERLCTRPEWVAACQGPGGSSYPYGDSHDATRCNTSGQPRAAGSFPRCRSPVGAYDMIGNVSEWVSDGTLAGGSALHNEPRTRCDFSQRVDATRGYSDVGFRCCVDAR
jgi:serine/threonine-protein kinase